jgi:hypothetical protein
MRIIIMFANPHQHAAANRLNAEHNQKYALQLIVQQVGSEGCQIARLSNIALFPRLKINSPAFSLFMGYTEDSHGVSTCRSGGSLGQESYRTFCAKAFRDSLRGGPH